MLAAEGVSIEVIDPRTLVPLDIDTILQSVRKTGRLIVVEECQPTGSWGSEVIASALERKCRIKAVNRIGTSPTPIPYTNSLENFVIPSVERIKEVIRKILQDGITET